MVPPKNTLQEILAAISAHAEQVRQGMAQNLGDLAQHPWEGLTGGHGSPMSEAVGGMGHSVAGTLQQMQQHPIDAMSGMIGPGELGMIHAYHGTPHILDHFDWSKIGSGEGNASYGHGHYLTGDAGIAGWYHDKLSNKAPPLLEIGGQTRPPQGDLEANVLARLRNAQAEADHHIPPAWSTSAPPSAYDRARAGLHIDARQVMADWQNHDRAFSSGGLRDFDPPEKRQQLDKFQAMHDLLNQWERQGAISREPGGVYKVAFDADPPELLQWDRSIAQQPDQIRGHLNEVINQNEEPLEFAAPPGYNIPEPNDQDYTGGEVYKLLSRGRDYDAESVSQDLHQGGIKGIQYLNGQNRSAGLGGRAAPGSLPIDPQHYNYVSFADKLLQILGQVPRR